MRTLTLTWLPYVYYGLLALGLFIGASRWWGILLTVQNVATLLIMVFVAANFGNAGDPLLPLSAFGTAALIFALAMAAGRFGRMVWDMAYGR